MFFFLLATDQNFVIINDKKICFSGHSDLEFSYVTSIPESFHSGVQANVCVISRSWSNTIPWVPWVFVLEKLQVGPAYEAMIG